MIVIGSTQSTRPDRKGGHSMSKRRVLLSLAVALLLLGGIVPGAMSADSVPEPSIPIVSCEEMPDLWSAATEIGYHWDDNLVSFTWPISTAVPEKYQQNPDSELYDGVMSLTPVTYTVKLSDSDDGCATQPGLVEFIRDLVQGEIDTALESCLDLKVLVAILREANPNATGNVPVPADADVEVLARRHPEALLGAEGEAFRASIIERNQQVPRMLDLDRAAHEITACR
jgi:hypothetical protein